MAKNREEKVNELYRAFGCDGLTRSVIDAVVDANNGDYDATADELLNMTQDTTGVPLPGSSAPPKPAALPSSQPAGAIDPSQHEKDISRLQEMFADGLTRSVIDVVYAQNSGDFNQACDTLLNIHHDEEAIEAIRSMGALQQKKMEQDMLAEQAQRVLERQLQMQKEIEEEKRKLVEIERRAKEEAAKRIKAEEEALAKLKKLREEEQRERELQEKQRKELQEAREEAMRKLKMEQLEAQEKAQQEKEAELKRKLEELEELRKAQREKEAQEIKAQKEREAQLVKEVEQRLEERKRAEELQKVAYAKEVGQKKEELKARELLMSRIIQEAALVTLSVRFSNKTIIVSWALGKDLQPQPNDWIGFYKVGQPNEKYREYIKTAGARIGHHHFNAPKTPGLYVFKYFSGGSYNDVASSDVLHLGPQVNIKASLVPAVDQFSTGSIEVTYTLTSGELATSDWIALYSAAENRNKQYLKLQYLKPVEVGKSATLIFEAPRTPGDYVLRFFPHRCKYTHVASSNRVRVENRDQIKVETIKDEKTGRLVSFRVSAEVFSVEPSSSDYVAIYRLDAPNNSYISYTYYDRRKPFAELPAPAEIESYEIRFHSAHQSKYQDVCRSTALHVQNTDWIKAETTAGLLTVHWDIHSQAKSTWDWVGIFPVGATNNKYISYKYVDVNSDALTFDVPSQPGQYEARYFSHALGRYTDFRKSKIFTIA